MQSLHFLKFRRANLRLNHIRAENLARNRFPEGWANVMSETKWMTEGAETTEAHPGSNSLFSEITPSGPAGKSSGKWAWIAVVTVVLAAITVFAVIHFRHRGRDVTYFTTSVARADVNDTVDATGTINAVTTVQVGAQVSGIISKLYADFNSTVHKGELLAQIDPRVYQGQLLQAQANVENARASLAASKANLVNAQAKAAQAKADYERATYLTKQGIMSAQSFDAVKATSFADDAQVQADEALDLQAAAQISQQEAALKVAQTNLAYTNIYAPIDGTVIDRAVDVGQTVAATFQTPTLFTIAQDLTKMQLSISTDEGDIGSVHVGAPVTFRVDAFPGETFNGRISQVRLNATTVQNVVTYDTIVDFDNPNRKLFPGMTAYATIPVQSVKDAVVVPNSALRYNPDLSQAELTARMAKYGIEVRGEPGTKTTSAASSEPTGNAGDVAVVWKLRTDKTIEPVLIRAGLSDHTSTAVVQALKGTLSQGDPVVTAEQAKSTGFGR